jgi:hypothetical protein
LCFHSLKKTGTSGNTPFSCALCFFTQQQKRSILSISNHWENNQRHSPFKITKTTMTKKNDEGSIRGSVRFADVVEADERRGDIAEAQPIPGSSAGHDDGVTGKDRRLSFVSRQYDIDGDGQLDEAEFASESVKPVLSLARH